MVSGQVINSPIGLTLKRGDITLLREFKMLSLYPGPEAEFRILFLLMEQLSLKEPQGSLMSPLFHLASEISRMGKAD